MSLSMSKESRTAILGQWERLVTEFDERVALTHTAKELHLSCLSKSEQQEILITIAADVMRRLDAAELTVVAKTRAPAPSAPRFVPHGGSPEAE